MERLLASVGRFTTKALVLSAHTREEGLTSETRRVEGPLLFERLWEACGIWAVLTEALGERRFTLPLSARSS